MSFDWKLLPLQRKLEWDLDLARGRLAVVLRGAAEAAAALRALEHMRSEQSAAAFAVARRWNDPATHGQSVAYLSAVEARLVHARAQCVEAEGEVAAARAECRRRSERVDALAALQEQAFASFTAASLREAAKEADFAWLARGREEGVNER